MSQQRDDCAAYIRDTFIVTKDHSLGVSLSDVVEGEDLVRWFPPSPRVVGRISHIYPRPFEALLKRLCISFDWFPHSRAIGFISHLGSVGSDSLHVAREWNVSINSFIHSFDHDVRSYSIL